MNSYVYIHWILDFKYILLIYTGPFALIADLMKILFILCTVLNQLHIMYQSILCKK